MPAFLLVEAFCLGTSQFATSLLSPLGLDTWCVSKQEADVVTVRYLHGSFLSQREARLAAFWLSVKNRDEILLPIRKSIIDGTPVRPPKINQSLLIPVYGIAVDSALYAFRIDRKYYAPLPPNVNTVRWKTRV